MNIEHINISAPKAQVKELKEFYCEIFQFKEGYRPQIPEPGHWLYDGDVPLIHLMERNERQPLENYGCFDHIAFKGEEVKNFVARLEKMNVNYRASWLAGACMTQLFFNDPVGIPVEVNFPNEKL